ncbi:hypothetical protein ZWY2020_057976 [Hordeum vulgare]|nr:hypothetical protein ZWY2020_057976 [Hordeum vulgare]
MGEVRRLRVQLTAAAHAERKQEVAEATMDELRTKLTEERKQQLEAAARGGEAHLMEMEMWEAGCCTWQLWTSSRPSSRKSASSSLKHQQLEVKAAPHKTVRLYLSLRRSCGPPLVDLARHLREQEGVPAVTCVAPSGLTSFVISAPEKRMEVNLDGVLSFF